MATVDDPAIRERVRALLVSAADQAVDRFRGAVRPIYGATRNGVPEHIGSAVLVEIDRRPCLVTAAHVLDHREMTTLYVGGASELLPLSGDFGATVAPKGDRNRDQYDFAVGELPPSVLDGLSGLHFVKPSQISPPGPIGGSRLFTAFGYPCSKNKASRAANGKVRGQAYQYSSFHRFQPVLAATLGASGDDHIFIDHQKYARDEAGQQTISIAPRGLSGGAVLEAADFSDRAVLLGQRAPNPTLAGIVIELYPAHRTLLAVRFDAILVALRSTEW